MKNIDVEEVIKFLNLKKHPKEGGYFIETYRSVDKISGKLLSVDYRGNRSLSTAIYYLLTQDTYSEMHRLISGEIYHFYIGDPVEMLQLYPEGDGKIVIIGNDIKSGMSLQVIVPGGVWQGSRLLPGGRFALMGTTVSPGFEFSDYESGKREELVKLYPKFKELIKVLT